MTTTESEMEVIENDGPSTTKSLLELLDIIYLDTTPTVDDSVCKLVSNRVKAKECSLVEVVEVLGPRLTSTHVLERSKAVEILAKIFTHLPHDFLNEAELTFIVEFLCDRCKDQHMVIPKIILCVLPIVKNKYLPTGAAKRLLDQLFREANIQSHIHKIRQTFFKTLQFLLANRLTELKEMSTDFVMNFLQAMDGEKDPRNLLILFRLIPTIIGNFKLDPFVEEFFEILSCYFPIDFNPTVTVPGEEKITRIDLAHALHICLSQTNEFSDFLLPLVMEKLESSSIDAKLDSLELMKLCCERSYTPQDLEPHLNNIWHAMRREIFMGGNDSVERKCYEFLTAAFNLISKDGVILNTCLSMIYAECKHHLSEPELRLIMPTANILRCISESGETACISVVQTLFPILFEQVCVKSTRNEKKRLLGIWETLISTCRQHKSIQLGSLVAKWDEMRALWFTLLANDDWELVTVVLNIFSHVTTNEADFPVEHRHTLLEHLLRLIKCSFTMPQNARDALVSLCCTLCQCYGEDFATAMVPVLLNTLCHSVPESGQPNLGSLCENNCDEKMPCQVRSLSSKVLGKCSYLNDNVFKQVTTTLLENLEKNPLDLFSMNCLECVIQEACMYKEQKSMKLDFTSHFSNPVMLDKVVSITRKICELIRSGDANALETWHHTGNSKQDGNSTKGWESIRKGTSMLRNILRASSQTEQAHFVEKWWNKKVNTREDIEKELEHIPGLMVEAILGPSRNSIVTNAKLDLIKHIIEKVCCAEDCASKSETHEFQTMPFVRLLASFINKTEQEEKLEEYLREIEPCFERLFDGSCQEKENMEHEKAADVSCSAAQANLVNSLIWIVKGLAMRSYPNLDLWVEKVVIILRNPTIGNEAVKAFPYLVADDHYCLNQESYCDVRLFYKQRLFLMVVDKLVSGYRLNPSEDIKFNFIRALSSLLKHVPSEILFIKIDSVLPLLVASLKCNTSSQVLLSTLSALTEMMQSVDTKPKLTEYSHDLVPQLTKLAQFKDSMEVRRASLSCLRQSAKSPAHLILPLRDSVIENLIPCLDDTKRLVRKEAALTKNIWTLIGAPGGI